MAASARSTRFFMADICLESASIATTKKMVSIATGADPAQSAPPNGDLGKWLMQELQEVVLRHLDATELAGCCAVCHSMRQIAGGHSLWHELFSRRWGAAYLSLLERAKDQEVEEEQRRRAFGDGPRGAYAVEHHDRTLTVDLSLIHI